MTLLAVALLAGGLTGGLLLAKGLTDRHAPAQGLTANEKYTCPMHPAVVKDAPGDCPAHGTGPASGCIGIAREA